MSDCVLLINSLNPLFYLKPINVLIVFVNSNAAQCVRSCVMKMWRREQSFESLITLPVKCHSIAVYVYVCVRVCVECGTDEQSLLPLLRWIMCHFSKFSCMLIDKKVGIRRVFGRYESFGRVFGRRRWWEMSFKNTLNTVKLPEYTTRVWNASVVNLAHRNTFSYA